MDGEKQKGHPFRHAPELKSMAKFLVQGNSILVLDRGATWTGWSNLTWTNPDVWASFNKHF